MVKVVIRGPRRVLTVTPGTPLRRYRIDHRTILEQDDVRGPEHQAPGPLVGDDDLNRKEAFLAQIRVEVLPVVRRAVERIDRDRDCRHVS